MLQPQQQALIRDLAQRCHALAIGPEYEARRRRWRDVNALRRPDRAPVWCKPVGCWAELLTETDLRCTEPPLRDMERAFRRWLIKHDIGDDSLIPPYWPVSAAVQLEGRHAWGVEIRHVEPASPGGAWRFDPPVKDEADLDRLTMPHFVHDKAETQRRVQACSDVLQDAMPVRVTGSLPLGPHTGYTVADLVGLDNLMLNLALKPEMMHRLFAFVQQGILRSMDEVEAMGILTENNDEEMYCSDPLREMQSPSPGRRSRIGISDLWGAANSQEFDQVSPEMWEEFELTYQKPIMARYGLVSYGCCENLTRKTQGVLTIPNLRIFVCSAWTDLRRVVDAVGSRYAIMWRQKASDVVFADDLGTIRRHLHEGMKLSQGAYRQVVLRELQTLNGHMRRLHEWTALAREAAEEFP